MMPNTASAVPIAWPPSGSRNFKPSRNSATGIFHSALDCSANTLPSRQLMALRMPLPRKQNSTHHQNSGRPAVPSKLAYLLKQVLIASVNSMWFSFRG